MNRNRISKEMLKQFPEVVVNEVKGTLRAYNSVDVIFENGEYRTSCGVALRMVYPEDFKVIGTVYAEDIFTESDKIVNYIEEFISFPIEYKGKKDWNMIKKLDELRGEGKQGRVEIDENGNAVLVGEVEI